MTLVTRDLVFCLDLFVLSDFRYFSFIKCQHVFKVCFCLFVFVFAFDIHLAVNSPIAGLFLCSR